MTRRMEILFYGRKLNERSPFDKVKLGKEYVCFLEINSREKDDLG